MTPGRKSVTDQKPPYEIIDAGTLESLRELPISHEKRLDLSLRKWTQIVLLVLFSATNITTISFFWLRAFSNAHISDWTLGELAGMTTAEVAGLMYVSSRYLFPGSERNAGHKGEIKRSTPKA